MATATRVCPAPYIDGICVHQLFDDVASAARSASPDLCRRLRFEVIEWEPLTAAADRRWLVEAVLNLLRAVAERSADAQISVRAFPSHDDCCVTFQIACPTNSVAVTSGTDDGAVSRCRSLIETMAGKMTVCACTEDEMLASFWLPQWVCAVPSTPATFGRAA